MPLGDFIGDKRGDILYCKFHFILHASYAAPALLILRDLDAGDGKDNGPDIEFE